jgi:hypothetical protein
MHDIYGTEGTLSSDSQVQTPQTNLSKNSTTPPPAAITHNPVWICLFFTTQHNRFVREAKNMSSKCELLFIGDSIIYQMLDKEVFLSL